MTATADCQRQLVFLDQHNRPAEPWIEEHLLDLGRLKRVRNHDLERVVPANDVDALAAQLIDDVLDAAAADADAGADTIHLQVDTGHGNFGAVAGFAGDRLDLDGPVGDFGNLVLEEPADEIGVRPGENDFHPVAGLANIENNRLDALAHVVRFPRNLLAAR